MGEDSQESESLEACLSDYHYFFKDDLLLSKVAFITGGGSGIGFRIAEIFMRHGCNTVIASRNSDRVKTAAETLTNATGRRCIPIQMDVRNPSEVLQAIEQAVRELGPIDILVNGAAGNFLCPADSLSFNGFKTVIAIDTLGTFNVTKAVYEKSMKQHGGSIINITATLHYTGIPLQAHAGSAKAAVDALTRHLAVEWGPGIRINSIAPGGVTETEGMRRLGGASEKMNEMFAQTIPLKRFATREDIANAALYLASEASSYVTGTCLVVDGGSWMTQGSSLLMRLDSKL